MPAMAKQRSALLWVIFCLAALCRMTMAQEPPSHEVAHCASVNTGADMQPIFDGFQSMGRCFRNCTDFKFAYGILLEKNCWCSNITPNPADDKPASECNFECPGFPADRCGGRHLYVYIGADGGTPTSTAPPAPVSSSSTTSSISAVVITVTETVQSTVSRPVTSTSSSSRRSSAFSSLSPSNTMATVTISGTVRTIVLTPSSTAGSQLAQPADPQPLSSGTIAGIAVGAVIGVIALAVLLWFIFARWLRKKDDDPSTPTRDSATGIIGTPKAMSESRYPDDAAPGWDSAGSSSRRRSQLMPIDPRLDPFAKGIYAREQNKSRDSVGSLRDDQDYSRRVHQPRVLRAMNPDPDVD